MKSSLCFCFFRATRYSVRYHTAAENALSQCVRSFLEEAAEHHYHTIALGNHSRHGHDRNEDKKNGSRNPLASKRRRHGDYPTLLSAHVTARTIRRFLDKSCRGSTHIDGRKTKALSEMSCTSNIDVISAANAQPVFDSVIICASSHEEYCALSDVLRYYFPR